MFREFNEQKHFKVVFSFEGWAAAMNAHNSLPEDSAGECENCQILQCWYCSTFFKKQFYFDSQWINTSLLHQKQCIFVLNSALMVLFRTTGRVCKEECCTMGSRNSSTLGII